MNVFLLQYNPLSPLSKLYAVLSKVLKSQYSPMWVMSFDSTISYSVLLEDVFISLYLLARVLIRSLETIASS